MMRPKRPPEQSFKPVGSGMLMYRICAKCDKRTAQAGGGYRLVRGAKQYVCSWCRAVIDGGEK